MAQRSSLPLHSQEEEQASLTANAAPHHPHHRIKQQDESHFVILENGSSVPLSDVMDKEERENPSDLLLRMMKKRAVASLLDSRRNTLKQ